MRVCNREGCGNPVFGGGLCLWHQGYRDKKPRLKGRRVATSKHGVPIKKVSDKLSKELKIYTLKRRIYLMENPNCLAKIEGCTGAATTIHHRKGRGKYLNDTSTWLGACMSCHHHIENFPAFAKENGFSVSRLAK